MFGLNKGIATPRQGVGDFGYLKDGEVYLDSACQSLRPISVWQAMHDYYHNYNACGDRARHIWGKQVDDKVALARVDTLNLVGLSSRKYFVGFTMNTTYGINLLLSQVKPGRFSQIVTTETEHNSVFLPTMVAAKRLGIPRLVSKRLPDGSFDFSDDDLRDAILVVSATNNFDGSKPTNLAETVRRIHKLGGVVIIDAAQAMAHNLPIIKGVEADAICFSSHKMHGPSLGVIVCRYDFLNQLDINLVGGGMVDSVKRDDYLLSSHQSDLAHTAFEAGLLPYGEIIGFGEAVKWLAKQNHQPVDNLGDELFNFFNESPHFHLINKSSSPIITFYHDSIKSDLLADALSSQGIMVRSGYFCVHYYLKEVMGLPQLVRISLGYHNTSADAKKLIDVLKGI